MDKICFYEVTCVMYYDHDCHYKFLTLIEAETSFDKEVKDKFYDKVSIVEWTLTDGKITSKVIKEKTV
jgi:hypothetical protein